MKKITKKIAAFLAAAVLLPVIPAGAASTVTKFPMNWVDNSYGGTKLNDAKIYYSDTFGYDDDSSIYASGTYTYQNGSHILRMKSDAFDIPAGTYTFKYYMRKYDDSIANMGNGHTHIEFVNLYANTIAGIDGTGSNMEGKLVGDNGWYEMTKTIEVPSDKTGVFLIIKFHENPNLYIDNMSLTDASGKNYIPNGDFDLYSQTETNLQDSTTLAHDWTFECLNMPSTESAYLAIDRSTGIGYDDDYALLAKTNWTNNAAGGKRLRLTATPYFVTAGKTYTLTMYVKGVGSAVGYGDTHVYLNNSYKNLGSMSNVSDGEWLKYTITDTPATSGYTTTYIQFYGTSGMYIDNIFLCSEDAPNVNLISNGDFSQTEADIPSYKGKEELVAWSPSFGWKTDETYKYSTVFAEPSTAYAHTGERSMFMTYPYATAASSFVSVSENVDIPAGTYTVSFWAKGSYMPSGVNVVLASANGYNAYSRLNNTSVGNSQYTAIESDGEWKKYSFTMTPTEKITRIQIIADNNVDTLYIDDISVTNANGTEYVKDGGFEKLASTTAIEKLMAYAAKSGKEGTVTWRNPKSSKITDIKVYVDDAEKTDFTADLTSGAYNEVILTDLINDKEYTVKIEATIDGVVSEYKTTLIPNDAAYKLGSWSILRNDGTTDGVKSYANAVATIDKTTGYNDNSSVKIVSNRNGEKAGTSFRLSQTVNGVVGGKTYQLSFRYKADNCESIECIKTGDSWGALALSDGKEDNGWGIKMLEYTPAESYNGGTLTFDISFKKIVDSIYIDDVRLEEVDTDEGGVIANSNLIKDGDFEFEAFEITEPKIELKVGDTWNWVTAVEEKGNYRAVASIHNISNAAPVSATLILAVYNGGRLISIVPTPVTVPRNEWVANQITAEIAVDDIEGCTIKGMLWRDGLGSLDPLTAAAEISESK